MKFSCTRIFAVSCCTLFAASTADFVAEKDEKLVIPAPAVCK